MKESPIFVKTQDFLLWLLQRTERFPKSQRFVMAKRVQDDILDFQAALIFATKRKDPYPSLCEADAHLELLRHHIRTCVDLQYLTVRQYEYSAGYLVEIGKLLGGWKKSLKARRQPLNPTVGVNGQ